MSIRSKLTSAGITFIDKLILAFALILVAMDSITDGWGALAVIIVVGGLYIGVMIFVNLATMGVVTNDGITRICLGILVAGFVFWLYPLVLELAFLIMGLKLSVDVKTVLLWTLIVRSFARFVLERRYGSVVE